jgi:predicted dehydrogenase
LKNTAALLAGSAAFPAIIPARALGRSGAVAPSNRIAVGIVGLAQGMIVAAHLLPFADVRVIALCDVDARRRENALRRVNKHYAGEVAREYGNFHNMFENGGLDAVVIAAPDHWHAIMAIAAARVGLDIYCETPLAHTLVEGRAIVEAVRQHGRILQMGNWQRSVGVFRRAVELVRNGRLGHVTHIETGTGGVQGTLWHALKSAPAAGATRPPPHLDYEAWVGPAAWTPYDARVTHYNWRWVLNYGGGLMHDWMGRHLDIVHWALGRDNDGPVKIACDARHTTIAPWDCEVSYLCRCVYADGLVLTAGPALAGGVRFYGERGWLRVDLNHLSASNPEILNEYIGEEEFHAYDSADHWRNFIDGIKKRVETVAPAEAGHRSASIAHLGRIASQTGRTIRWDPFAETIKDDPAASALLLPNYRSPWAL